MSVFVGLVFGNKEIKNEVIEQSAHIEETLDTWQIFIEALIQVESGGNDYAVGRHEDGGALQLTKIAIIDCNRILGVDYYTLEDRFNREKSIEIFNVLQNHYNPEHDMHLALKIHNSRAPLSYHIKVMNKYNELKNNGSAN